MSSGASLFAVPCVRHQAMDLKGHASLSCPLHNRANLRCSKSIILRESLAFAEGRRIVGLVGEAKAW